MIVSDLQRKYTSKYKIVLTYRNKHCIGARVEAS